MENEMNKKVRLLGITRDTLEVDKKMYKDYLDKFEVEHKELKDTMTIYKDRINTLQKEIKEHVLNLYEADKTIRKFECGTGVRVGEELKYDKEKAFEWAKEHDLCIQLDVGAFESIAKTQKVSFVTKIPKITPTIPGKIKWEEKEQAK